MSLRWTARLNNWAVSWSEEPPHIQGPGEIIVEIQRELFSNDGVQVTPTGPFLPAELSSSEAVALSLSRLYPDASFDNFPDLVSLWDHDIPDDVVF